MSSHSRVRFLTCELCKRRVEKRFRILGNQEYYYRLRGFQKTNNDPIIDSGNNRSTHALKTKYVRFADVAFTLNRYYM